MMKKKSTDTEEKKESGQTKHSDNKDNSTNFTDNLDDNGIKSIKIFAGQFYKYFKRNDLVIPANMDPEQRKRVYRLPLSVRKSGQAAKWAGTLLTAIAQPIGTADAMMKTRTPVATAVSDIERIRRFQVSSR